MEASRQCFMFILCIALCMCLITTSATTFDCSDCTDQGFFDMNPSLCRNFCMNNLVNKRSSCDQCSSVRCTLLCSRKRSYDPNQENHREVQKRTQVSQMCILDDLYQDLPEEGKTEVINTFARWIHFD